MSEWKETALSEVIDLVGGGTPKTNCGEFAIIKAQAGLNSHKNKCKRMGDQSQCNRFNGKSRPLWWHLCAQRYCV